MIPSKVISFASEATAGMCFGKKCRTSSGTFGHGSIATDSTYIWICQPWWNSAFAKQHQNKLGSSGRCKEIKSIHKYTSDLDAVTCSSRELKLSNLIGSIEKLTVFSTNKLFTASVTIWPSVIPSATFDKPSLVQQPLGIQVRRALNLEHKMEHQSILGANLLQFSCFPLICHVKLQCGAFWISILWHAMLSWLHPGIPDISSVLHETVPHAKFEKHVQNNKHHSK